MSEKLKTKGKLIVAEMDYWPFLLSLKAKNPAENIKVLTPENFLDLACFSYSDDPIPELIKAGYTYNESKKWMWIGRFIETSDDPETSKVIEILSKHKKIDPLGMREISHREILLFEMAEDLEIHGVCKRLGLEAKDIFFETLGAKKKFDESKETFPILSFQNRFEQTMYLFSRLRERFLKHPEDVENVFIHVDSGDNLFYVRLCSDLFDLPVFVRAEIPFWSAPEVAKKMIGIFEQKKISFSDEELQKHFRLKVMKALAEKYGLLDETISFEHAYINLQEIISAQSETTVISDSGPIVCNDFVINPKSDVYLLDFVDGRFYQASDDKNVLSDSDLLKNGVNPSYVRTLLDKRKKLNFLRYSKLSMVSRVQEHLSDKIYDSAFISEWDELYYHEKPIWKKLTKITSVEGGVWTDKALKVLRAHGLDKNFYHKPIGEILGYDHSFKGLESWAVKEDKVWSVTNIETYVNCPFQYWLKQIIPAKDTDWHAALLGTLIHKVFESSLEEETNFDSAFEQGVKAYKEDCVKKGVEFGPREEALLEVYRRGLKNVSTQPERWKKVAHICGATAEDFVRWTLTDSQGKEYPFAGRIDRIIYFGRDANEPDFYYIGDYKTGIEVFTAKYVFLGKAIQLPLYAYALKQKENEKLTKGATFAGFGIETAYFSGPKQAAEKNDALSYETLEDNMRFKGVVLENEDFWDLADPDSRKDDKELTQKFDGSFIAGTGRFDSETLGDVLSGKMTEKERKEKQATGPVEKGYSYAAMEKDAISSALETIHHIEKADFEIAPTLLEPDKKYNPTGLACKFCQYGDICFRKISQDFRDLSGAIEDHFETDYISQSETNKA